MYKILTLLKSYVTCLCHCPTSSSCTVCGCPPRTGTRRQRCPPPSRSGSLRQGTQGHQPEIRSFFKNSETTAEEKNSAVTSSLLRMISQVHFVLIQVHYLPKHYTSVRDIEKSEIVKKLHISKIAQFCLKMILAYFHPMARNGQDIFQC